MRWWAALAALVSLAACSRTIPPEETRQEVGEKLLRVSRVVDLPEFNVYRWCDEKTSSLVFLATKREQGVAIQVTNVGCTPGE